MGENKSMSVIFYDSDNIDNDVNFSNANACMVLSLMGLLENSNDLFGKMDGDTFRKHILLGLSNVSFSREHYEMERRLNNLAIAFRKSKWVCWG